MKIGKTRLRMSSGEIRKFSSEKARNAFERVAQAVKHGWKPTRQSSSKKRNKCQQNFKEKP